MKPNIQYIPYRQTGEPDRTAAIAPVQVDISSRSQQEQSLIRELSAAADSMNPIFRNQFCKDTEDIIDVLTSLSTSLPETEREAVRQYLTILTLQNSPWSFLPRKNHLLGIERETLREAARKVGEEQRLAAIEPYLFYGVPLPDKAMFYPESLTDKDLEALGSEAKRINTRIIENGDTTPHIILNEHYYRGACEEAVQHLKKARQLTDSVSFRLYLDAKIEELNSGSEEARRLADYHWIRHDSPIDIVISTAIEVYLDNWKNQKGTAGAVVMVENPAYRDFLRKLLSRVQDMERHAPWRWRRDTIAEESLPKLKYVDVINWSGEYISSPMTVLAQSLPNDEWIGKNIGTVNMVYVNTSRAVFDIQSKPQTKEFFPSSVYRDIADMIFDGNILHSALHEIGHTTGRQDPDHQGQPSNYFQNEYSALEETRAELFGMWAADFLRDRDIISEEQCRSSHYHMLLSMVTGLRFEPVQAHNIARNIIFHYLVEKKAIVPGTEQEKRVFSLDLETLTPAVEELLGRIGNLKASGDKEAFVSLRKKYCFTDPLREEIDRRMRGFSLGTGLIFPDLTGDGSYPDFDRQPKFIQRYRFGS